MKKWPSIVSIVLFLAIGAYAIDVIVYNAGQGKKPEVANVEREAKPNPPTRKELLRLVNDERAKHGVAPLKEDAKLDSSAQWKAADMSKRNYFSHEDPETGKKNGLDEALKLTGSKCSYVSENIYYGSGRLDSSIEAIRWWIKSKSHHAAMIDEQYMYTGFGISNGNIVEHFCRLS